MKTIKTKIKLLDFKSQPIKNGGEELELGFVVSNVLSGQVSNPTLGWILGKKFATEGEVELKAEEMIFVRKELLNQKTWVAIVVGQILEILGE